MALVSVELHLELQLDSLHNFGTRPAPVADSYSVQELIPVFLLVALIWEGGNHA